MRLAALGLMHESNTFASQPADLAAFQASQLYRGEEIRVRLGESHQTMAGFLDVHDGTSVVVEPLMFGQAGPRGPITKAAFERLGGEMLDMLRERGPWDGVLMAQHGAAVSEEHVAADAELVGRARAIVGPRVPIGVALDLHGNLSRGVVEQGTVTIAYRTNPHGDARERARECAGLVIRTVRGEIAPVQAWVPVPLVPNILNQSTDLEPMRTLYGSDLAQVLGTPGVLSATIMQGYPYADVPDMAMSCVVVADRDPANADRAARWLAARVWARRDQLDGHAPTPEQAIARAAAAPAGPVVLLDVGDNIGGGSPGDSTVLLEEALRQGLGSLLLSLRDPEAVDRCQAAGEGGRVAFLVGGKTDGRHGRPVPVEGTVVRLHDGRFEDPGPTHGGMRFVDAGPTAVLRCAAGPTIVLHTHAMMNSSLEEHRSVGLDPTAFQAVIAKGVNAPRFAYVPIATELIQVDTPGVTSADLSRFNYRNRPRPLFPFERDAVFEGGFEG
ncbi:MAG: M81 family metallopeptidase [Candidatus Dormibacteraceae bacterium]